MVGLHNTVGTLVVLAYLVLTVLYALWAAGRPLPAVRIVSGVAAGLLLIQYILGFWLLGDGHRNVGSHYVFALLPILTLGLEHGYARSRPTPQSRATMGAVGAGLTFILVTAAYIIGSS